MDRYMAAGGWKRALFYLVQFTWGLPVNLVGLVVFLCCRGRPHRAFCNSVVTLLPGHWGGMSLGVFIFIGEPEPERLYAHEYGHTIQCLVLGPLYWLLISLPSAVWYHCFRGSRKRRGLPYDWLYCERWATAWGRRWTGLA